MNPTISVEAVKLTKKYGARVLFSDVSFSVKAGECLGVTGHNGSGKSTLLKIIAGVVRPSSGSAAIRHGGLDTGEEERLHCLGLVSPEMQMYDSLSGYENIILLAGSRGLTITAAEAGGFCERLGLGQKGTELVKTYSTGMKQRLKFALLLAAGAPVWLLDEPSSNLDREGKNVILAMLTYALKQGKVIILATNDEAEVRYAHKTIALS